MSPRARRPPGGSALRPVRRQGGGVRCIRLLRQSMEPGHWGVFAHSRRTH